MSKQGLINPGSEAQETKGWFKAHKWLLARRAAQLGFLSLFLIGPVTGFWLVKGTIAQSLTLDILPLTDPFVALQVLAAHQALGETAIIGAVIVFACYALLSGRLYCSWVCPINPISDLAGWLRRKLGLKGGLKLNRATRYWVMAGLLLGSFATGTLIWEAINPITTLYRGLVFGGLLTGLGGLLILALFVFDLLITDRGWCAHLCPVGAFYGLIGQKGLLKVSANQRANCNDCMDCYAVCPERHVISPALKGEAKGQGPVILHRDCTDCGRCIDVCSKDVFNFQLGRKGPSSMMTVQKPDATANRPHSKAA